MSNQYPTVTSQNPANVQQNLANAHMLPLSNQNPPVTVSNQNPPVTVSYHNPASATQNPTKEKKRLSRLSLRGLRKSG